MSLFHSGLMNYCYCYYYFYLFIHSSLYRRTITNSSCSSDCGEKSQNLHLPRSLSPTIVPLLPFFISSLRLIGRTPISVTVIPSTCESISLLFDLLSYFHTCRRFYCYTPVGAIALLQTPAAAAAAAAIVEVHSHLIMNIFIKELLLRKHTGGSELSTSRPLAIYKDDVLYRPNAKLLWLRQRKVCSSSTSLVVDIFFNQLPLFSRLSYPPFPS